MSLLVTVKGGTGAGVRRPLRDRPADWTCACGQHKPGYLLRCWTCGTERP